MSRSPSFVWSKSRAYAPQTNLCTIVVSTNPTHSKHSSITDLCAIATPPILRRSRCPRENRRRPSNEVDVSHPRPLPSVVRYWLEKKAGLSYHRRRRRLIQTYNSPHQRSVCVTLQQPMVETSCEWTLRTENLRHVKAEPTNNEFLW